jgi:hypothetical protein
MLRWQGELDAHRLSDDLVILWLARSLSVPCCFNHVFNIPRRGKLSRRGKAPRLSLMLLSWIWHEASCNGFAPMRRRAVIVMLVNILICKVAHAECLEMEGPAPRPHHPIAMELSREAAQARTWRYSWTAINGGLTLLPIGGLIVLPRTERGDLLISAVTSAISTMFTWFWGLDVEEDAGKAARLRATEPGACDPELRALFVHSRDDEAERFAWYWHVGNFVTALIPAGIILVASHDRKNAALAAVGGFALGEAELLTQPVGLVDQRTPRSMLAAATLGRSWVVTYRVTW